MAFEQRPDQSSGYITKIEPQGFAGQQRKSKG